MEPDTTQLYITRHGQTVWNLEKRMQGHQDSPLTDMGVRQAELLSNALQDTFFNTIYSSPIGRAYKTSKIIRNNRDLEIRTDNRLKEISLGNWEGMTLSEIDNAEFDMHQHFWKAPHLYKPPVGETFQDVRKRTVEFITDILKAHNGERILCVTHAVVLKTIMSYFENRPLQKFWEPPVIQPTSLSIVEIINGNSKILQYADTSHME